MKSNGVVNQDTFPHLLKTVFGLPEGSSESLLKRRWKFLSCLHHPDKKLQRTDEENIESFKKMKQINEWKPQLIEYINERYIKGGIRFIPDHEAVSIMRQEGRPWREHELRLGIVPEDAIPPPRDAEPSSSGEASQAPLPKVREVRAIMPMDTSASPTPCDDSESNDVTMESAANVEAASTDTAPKGEDVPMASFGSP